MCLAIPGKVESVFEIDGLKMGKVDFAGVKRSICLDCTPDVVVGSYVLVHVGFAISVINEEEAERNLALLRGDAEFQEFIQSVDDSQ